MKPKSTLLRCAMLCIAVLFFAFIGSNTASAQTTQIYSTPGTFTWTCPEGITYVTVECWGGGGAGGSARASSNLSYTSGGGGAGGAYVYSKVPVIAGSVYKIIVGQSVSAPTTSSYTSLSRVDGKQSTFSLNSSSTYYVYAQGGQGGQSVRSSTTGGLGGTASSSLSYGYDATAIIRKGGNGAAGAIVPFVAGYGGGGGSSAGKLSDGNPAALSIGGGVLYGGAAGGNGATVSYSNSVGVAGNSPGGGGGGSAQMYQTPTTQKGGNGAAGQVVLTYAACAAPTITPANPLAAICSGSVQSLAVDTKFNTTVTNQPIGSDAGYNASTSYPNPLNTFSPGVWTQCLISATQLTNMGFIEGSKITSLKLNVASINTTDAIYNSLTNFTISMGSVSPAITALSNTFITGLTQVYTHPSYPVNLGTNTWDFTTPFYWDGASPVIVEIIFSGTDASIITGGSTSYYTTSTATNTVSYYVDPFFLFPKNSITQMKVDGYASGTLSNQLPNITFSGTNPTSTWSPVATLYTDNLGSTSYTGDIRSTVYAKPTVTTTYTVSTTNGSCSNTGTVTVPVSTNQQWTGTINSDWNIGGNWCSGVIPNNLTDVIIPTGVTNYPEIKTADAWAKSVTISPGASLIMLNAYNLTISSIGSFANSGSFGATGSSGAVVFEGTGTITGTTSFKNVTINGTVDFGTSSTVTGNLTVNSGNASGGATRLVNYTPSSTLIYNGTITTGNEWYTGDNSTPDPGVGIPHHVTIQSGTATVPNSGGNNRAITGNLTIGSGANLQMTSGTRDLYVFGNWANSGGSFTANGRRVIFKASSGTQTVSGNTEFYDITLDNGGASTDFTNSTITMANEFRVAGGTMNGNTSTFIFTGATSTLEGVGSKYFYNLQIDAAANLSDLTASAGNTHIANSFENNGILFNQNVAHTTYFDKTNATETFSGTGSTTFGKLVIGDNGFSFRTTLNAAANFTVAGGSMSFFNNSIYNGTNNTATFSTSAATVSGTGTANFHNAITNVALNVGSGISTINNILQINTGGSVITNVPMYASAASLIYNTTNPAYPMGLEWFANTATPGAGAPFNVTVQNANNVIMAGPRTVPGTLTIANANTLDINGHTLTANGTVTGTGTLTGSETSGLVLAGAAGTTGTLYFTPGGSDNYLKLFAINSGKNADLGNALNITAGTYIDPGVLTAHGILNANGNLTIKSGVLGDGRVDISNGTINGEVTVERFVHPRRAWRLMTVPFKQSPSDQTINAAWQEGQVSSTLPTACPTLDPAPDGYGMYITNNGTNGYDQNTTTNPSLRGWENSMWVVPPSTLTKKITDYEGYMAFVRGDRHICIQYGTAAGSNPTVLRAKGVLNQNGSDILRSFTTTATEKRILIGNPYVSPLRLTNVIFDGNINANSFTVLDPLIGGTYGTGAYNVFNTGINSWSTPGGVYDLFTSEPVIQSGQAFFVEGSFSATHSVTFKETAKSTLQFNTTGLARAQPQKETPVLYSQLLITQDSMKVADGVAVGFKQKFSYGKDEYDSPKFWTPEGESMAIANDTSRFAVDCRPVPRLTDTIFFKLYLRIKPYTLRFFARNPPGNLPGKTWLVDNYLGTKTELKLGDTTLYDFTPTSDTNTYRNRFMIVWSRTDGSIVKPGKPEVSSISKATVASLYPNPVSDNQFNLVLTNVEEDNYTVNIYANDGRLVVVHKLEFVSGKQTYQVNLPSTITSGSYRVQVLNSSGEAISSMPLIINR